MWKPGSIIFEKFLSPRFASEKPGEVLDILDFLSTQPSDGAVAADSLMRLLSE